MASSVQKQTEINNHEKLLKQLFNCAISQALPTKTITEFVPQNSKGKTVIIGCGKASALMAKQFDECSDLNVSGLVVAPYGNRVKLNRIEVIEAAHPVPDQNSVKAAERLLSMASKLGESDLLIFLVSGGGSAMTCLPAPGLSIIDKQSINEALLKCGANIKEMNCVRKHLSAIKGGQLAAAAYPAKTLTLALSDIPGDDPSVIASGPTVADITTSDDALKIIKKYGMLIIENIKQ